MNALPYFLTASLYLLLFYGCYWLLLRRNTFFTLNRVYLLGSVVLSLLLPLVELPDGSSDSLPIGTMTLPTFAVGTTTDTSNELTINQWLWLVYGLGVCVMLIRLGLNLGAIFTLIRQGTIENHPNFILVRLPHQAIPSFSFGKFLVLNQTDALTEPDALLRHEEAHIRQQHTTDILFIELIRVAFWFHPVLWLYKRALQEVHEFLADKAVLQTPQPDYAHQLVAYALNVPSAALTTPFVSISTLKQRIVMLQKPQSNRRALLGYALVLPLAALLVMCTQPDKEVAESPIVVNQPARQAGIDDDIFTVVENQPEFPGGMKGLGEFVEQNLKYPTAAQKAFVSGKVFISFIVTKAGDIADVKILKGMGFGTDEEAIRVVKQMPRWKPGTQNGHTVNVRYALPINFELNSETDKMTEVPLTNGKQPPSVTVPTNDADIQRLYKHFIVDGREVPFEEFKTYRKNAIIEANPSGQQMRIQTTPPPPPPAPDAKSVSAPASKETAFEDIKYFMINGKQSTKEALIALPPDKIIRMDVNKEQGTIAVTIK